MIGVDDIDVIVSERKLSKRNLLPKKEYSISLYRGIKKNPDIKNSGIETEEYPIDQWLMPPQPECYLKYPDHDFF